MRTLLIESNPGAGAAAAADLRAAGHSVARCHEADQPSFPCAAVVESGSCPLEGEAPADVVLVARSGADAVPTGAEGGVSCAVKLGVPVVVMTPDEANPYRGWSTSSGLADPVAVCEHAVGVAREALVAPLRAEVVRMLETRGVDDAAAKVDVELTREGRRAQLVVHVPADSPVGHETIATHVRDHFRASAPAQLGSVEVTDVAVRSTPAD